MTVIYHPEAETELIEAAQFYHCRVPGLGKDFLDTVDASVALLVEAPERWRIVERDVRVCLLPRFPFALIYRVCSGELRILAVKHHSRRPDCWRERIDG